VESYIFTEDVLRMKVDKTAGYANVPVPVATDETILGMTELRELIPSCSERVEN
jgi:hypothetical protein